MEFAVYLVKKNVLKISLFAALFLWAVSASFVAMTKKNQVVLIGLDENGTRIISQKEDPLYRVEVKNFLLHFIESLYSFTPENFTENVGQAADLMSKNLWESKKSKLLGLSQKVSEQKIHHTTEVEKITKLEKNLFNIIFISKQKSKLKVWSRKISAKIQLSKTARTQENPWGMEVTSLEETSFN